MRRVRGKIEGEEKKSQLQAVSFSGAKNNGALIATLKKSQLDTYDEIESYKKLRTKRKHMALLRMFVWICVILLIPVIVFFSMIIIDPTSGHNFFGYNFFIVETDSMKQYFDVGDCIIVKSVGGVEDIKIGSDITFVRKKDGEVVTHRVIAIEVNEDGQYEYVTRGTNVANADPELVNFNNVIGVRIKTLHILGQCISFFRTPYGIIIFVAVFVLTMFGIYLSFKASDDIRAIGQK